MFSGNGSQRSLYLLTVGNREGWKKTCRRILGDSLDLILLKKKVRKSLRSVAIVRKKGGKNNKMVDVSFYVVMHLALR